jgi:hypothetical protein
MVKLSPVSVGCFSRNRRQPALRSAPAPCLGGLQLCLANGLRFPREDGFSSQKGLRFPREDGFSSQKGFAISLSGGFALSSSLGKQIRSWL